MNCRHCARIFAPRIALPSVLRMLSGTTRKSTNECTLCWRAPQNTHFVCACAFYLLDSDCDNTIWDTAIRVKVHNLQSNRVNNHHEIWCFITVSSVDCHVNPLNPWLHMFTVHNDEAAHPELCVIVDIDSSKSAD